MIIIIIIIIIIYDNNDNIFTSIKTELIENNLCILSNSLLLLFLL